ncbi:MAG: hypothetical protein ACOC0A_05385, partial [Planctomycetota bacterium]
MQTRGTISVPPPADLKSVFVLLTHLLFCSLCLVGAGFMGNLVPEARAAEADDDAGLIIPAEMQEDEETASDELQLGLQEDGTVVLLGEEGVVPVLRSELHICGHSWQPVLAQQEELIDTVEEDGTIVQSYQMEGQEAEGAVLEVRYKKSGNGLSVTWRADVSEELKEKMGDNTRWLFYDPDEEPQAFPQLKSEMWSRTRSV